MQVVGPVETQVVYRLQMGIILEQKKKINGPVERKLKTGFV